MVAESGSAVFSMRALGEKLGVDPTAVYRHFADRDDLLREVGDRALAPVFLNYQTSEDPRHDIIELCSRLRSTLIGNPIGLEITAQGPTRRTNELQITETILEALLRTGISSTEAAIAYHVIIEYTLGSAWLDAPLAQVGAKRADTYVTWRSDYAQLDPNSYPATHATAIDLYPPSELVFEAGLHALISGIIPQ